MENDKERICLFCHAPLTAGDVENDYCDDGCRDADKNDNPSTYVLTEPQLSDAQLADYKTIIEEKLAAAKEKLASMEGKFTDYVFDTSQPLSEEGTQYAKKLDRQRALVEHLTSLLTGTNSSPINQTNMDFFQTLAGIAPGIDLSIRLKEKNGTITMTILPEVGSKTASIKPIRLKGTPAECDGGFFEAITKPLQDAVGLLVNAEDFKKSVESAAAKADKPDKDKNKTAEEKSPSKPTSKKAEKSKSSKSDKKERKKKDEKPAIKAPDIFAPPAESERPAASPADTPEPPQNEIAVDSDAGPTPTE